MRSVFVLHWFIFRPDRHGALVVFSLLLLSIQIAISRFCVWLFVAVRIRAEITVLPITLLYAKNRKKNYFFGRWQSMNTEKERIKKVTKRWNNNKITVTFSLFWNKFFSPPLGVPPSALRIVFISLVCRTSWIKKRVRTLTLFFVFFWFSYFDFFAFVILDTTIFERRKTVLSVWRLSRIFFPENENNSIVLWKYITRTKRSWFEKRKEKNVEKSIRFK